MAHCPQINDKTVRDKFNSIVTMFNGSPLSIEEFKSVELRDKREDNELTAMNIAYKVWDITMGENIPNTQKDIINLIKNNNQLEEIQYNSNGEVLAPNGNVSLQGAYDFGASSNSGKWNNANNELKSLVQNNGKAFAIYKFMIGEVESFKEIIDFLNEKGIKIEYTDRMKRADETMTKEEITSALNSYNNKVEEKKEDKAQIEKDILSENNLKDETEYTPQELIDKFPLTGVQKVIWNLIKDIVDKLGIKVKFSSGRLTEGFDGSNNSMNGEILIRPSTLKNGRFTEVLVHEIVHALTTKIINKVNSGNLTNLTKSQINAVKGLQKLFESVRDNNNLQDKYPVKDIFEFIAHLTNETFVKELESKDRNFIQKVIDFISDILGINNANELAKKYLKDIISDGVFLQEQGITVLPSDYIATQGSKSIDIKYDQKGNVLAKNGNVSKLYKDIEKLEEVSSKEQALQLYKQTRSKEFKEWFGNSKVVDENFIEIFKQLHRQGLVEEDCK